MLTAEQQARKDEFILRFKDGCSGRPFYIAGEPCQQCYRAQLQLLVVLPSVVAKDHEAALAQAGVSWPAAFDPALERAKLTQAAPVARVMREGYVYLYYPDKQRWDIWQIMQNGLTRQLLQQVRVPHYAKGIQPHLNAGEIKQCRQGAANHQAHLISIHGANMVDSAWMAFSPRLWSEATLQRYTDNADVAVKGPTGQTITKKAREWRGVSFSPKSVVQGQRAGAHMLPLDAEHLSRHVIDFADGKSGFWPSIALRKAFAAAIDPINPIRFGAAAEFAQRVRRAEAHHAPQRFPDMFKDKSVVLMLDDPEGVVEQLNELRNAHSEAATKYAAEHHRAFLCAEAIESVKIQVEAQAHTQAEEAFDQAQARRREVERHNPVTAITKMGPDGKPVAWKPAQVSPSDLQAQKAQSATAQAAQAWRKYADKVRDDERQKFLNTFRATLDKHNQAMARAAADHLAWLSHPRTQAMWQTDFDTACRRDGVGYGQMACNLIHGMTITPQGDAWVKAQLQSMMPGAPEAVVWNSLYGNQMDLAQQAAQAVRAVNTGTIYGLTKEALGVAEEQKHLPAGRWAGGWERALATVAGPLAAALADDKTNRVVKTLFEGVIWTRAGAMWAQHQYTSADGLRGVARFFEYSAWRLVDLTLTLDGSNPFAFKRDFATRVPVPGQAPVLAATLPQPKPNAASGLRYVVVAPETVASAQASMRQFGQMREVSAELAADAFDKVRRGFNMDGKLGAISLVFELVNYFKAEEAIAQGDRFKQPEAKATLRAAVLGGINAVADVRAGWVQGVYGQNMQWGITKGLGGLCGGVASYIGAYWAYVNAEERLADGKKGLAYLYYSASVAGVLSGTATIASGGSAFAQVRGWLTPKQASTTRVWAGRMAIRSGLVGLAVGALIWALEEDAMQQWMARSHWGRKPEDQRWRDWEEEKREYDKVVKVKPT